MLRQRFVDLLMPESSGPMEYALDRRTFWYSHYLSTGMRTSSGILLIALLGVFFVHSYAWMVGMSLGAAAIALVDQSGPWRNKVRELPFSLLINMVASLGVGLLVDHEVLQALLTVCIAFASGFLLLYGNRGMPIQFSLMLAVSWAMIHVDKQQDVLVNSLSMGLGSLIYVVYALTVSYIQKRRLKQQVLAECLFALAKYLDIKRGFYEPHANLDEKYTQLIRQQVVLSDKQQAARDLVLQQQEDSQQDARLIQIHLAMIDVYEQILTTHADYTAIHRYFGDHEVLLFLRDLIDKAMRDIEKIAYAVSRDQPVKKRVSYVAEQRAIEYDLQQLANADANAESLVILRSTYNKILDVVARIRLLHNALEKQPENLPVLNMRLFVSRPSLRGRMIIDNFTFKSPIFRFSVRIAMAVATALALAEILPYGSHAYWILLTLVIIIKPTYSMTRTRRHQRLIGTAIGCVLSLILMQVVREPAAMLLIMYFSLMVSSTFIQIRFVYASIAATVTVMMLLQLTAHNSSTYTYTVLERLADTILGVGIAAAFSFVLPSWERQAIPGLLKRMFESASTYLDESRLLLEQDQMQDQPYRVARKQFLTQIAGVNAALLRMLDEPRGRQLGVTEITQLLVRTYLMTSHVAALRMVLRRNPSWQDAPAFTQIIEDAMQPAQQDIQMASAVLTVPSGNPLDTDSLPAITQVPLATIEDLPNSTLHARTVLRDRMQALRNDARDLLTLSTQARATLLQTA